MVLDYTHNIPFIVGFVRGLNYLRVPKSINIAPVQDLIGFNYLRSVDLRSYENEEFCNQALTVFRLVSTITQKLWGQM
jgi:hypothetical protein